MPLDRKIFCFEKMSSLNWIIGGAPSPRDPTDDIYGEVMPNAFLLVSSKHPYRLDPGIK